MIEVLTIKCDCKCPQMVHSHVGCMGMNCNCQHGILVSVGEALIAGYSLNELEKAPQEFVDSWKKENPDLDLEEYLLDMTEQIANET